VIIFGSYERPLLWTWISIDHSSGNVWVGPGVDQDTVGIADCVGVAVKTGVGGVVTGAGVCCVHPVTSKTSNNMIPSPMIPDMNFP
jgi:hypothetical protein